MKSGESRIGPDGSPDVLTASALLLSLAILFASTRSKWLDDSDSVNLALALDDFNVSLHQPHPPGYPLFVAAGKISHIFLSDFAAALTLVSAIAGAFVGSAFYLLARRQFDRSAALAGTTVMALSPLFWLQSGLALTDMLGLACVVLFMLIEGRPTESEHKRRLLAGIVAGLSLGARPHMTFLILCYWSARAIFSCRWSFRHFFMATAAFALGVAIWLVPTCVATGGLWAYLSACLDQFEWRLQKPDVSMLGVSLDASYFIARAEVLFGTLGEAFSPLQVIKSKGFWPLIVGLAVIIPYVVLAWHSAARNVVRPYVIAFSLYLLMLFVLLPVATQRYFLPFCLIVGWAAASLINSTPKILPRLALAVTLLTVTVLWAVPLVRQLSERPPPVAALEWMKAKYPDGRLYSDELSRHAAVYWSGVRPIPKTAAECNAFLGNVTSTGSAFATINEVCGASGTRIKKFTRDNRVHSKHFAVRIFAFTKE